jgi:hypothetical protein
MDYDRSIQTYIDLSERAYDNYLKDEKKFRAALVLYKLNSELFNHITINLSKIVDSLHFEYYTHLMEHLAGWLSQFELEERSQGPDPCQLFNWARWDFVRPYPKRIDYTM